MEWNSSDASNGFPSRSSGANLLQQEPSEFLDQILTKKFKQEILTKMIMGKSHLPNHSAGIPV